jgi:preprotein translocase subunit SecF
MNISINQTLSRTIMTSLTTLLVVMTLFVLGGEIIHNFSLALLIGIIVGTYSSIYVASALALVLGVSKEDLMAPPKDEVDREALEKELQRAFLETEAKRNSNI